MKEETKVLVKYRLQRARESLSDAEKYLEGVSLNSTVNRYIMLCSTVSRENFVLLKLCLQRILLGIESERGPMERESKKLR